MASEQTTNRPVDTKILSALHLDMPTWEWFPQVSAFPCYQIVAAL